LMARHAGRPRIRALAYQNYGFGGTASARDTTHHEILRLAGLENILAGDNALVSKPRSGSVKIAYEDLLVLDPDLIVVGEREDGGPSVTAELLYEEPALARLRAVRERSIIALPARLYSTVSHEILRGAEILSDRVD